ncbi:hypothetical protein M9Y10_008390 [Tritrichomonas musculus]|uniref:Uncharacterized protein n=1 Tax=Tritrichomonas musculus TaxID=1915356 RepID=A0ABR2IYX3_9EUKA
MMDQFGNEIPAELYPLAFIGVYNKNDISKSLIEYHVDVKEVFDRDRDIFDDACFDGPVFHYNYEKHHEALGDEILFVFGYNPVIKPIVSYNVFITFEESNSTVTPIRSDKIKESSKYYTVEYLNNHEQPGLMSSRSVNLQELQLRGELMIDIIFDKTNIKTENVIKCKELIADNGFQLYRSPLIFIYEPEDYGVELIHGIKYWYIDFGYSHDSDEFKALANHQPFEFIDSKIFGLNYCIKKELIAYQGSTESKWTGNNIYYHLKDRYGTVAHHDSDIQYISLIVSNSDLLKLVLMKKWGIKDNGQSPVMIHNYTFLYDCMSFELVNGDKVFPMSDFLIVDKDASLTSFYYENEYCALIKFKLKYNGDESWVTHAVGVLKFTFTSPIDESIKLTFETKGNVIVEDQHMLHATNDIYISSIALSMYDRIETTSYDNNKLRLYLREGFFYQIPEEDVKYVAGTNPFGYLFANQAYDFIPKPEACSYLSTPHNIRTDGIVIGSNIETHSFLLNDLGNNVTLLGGEIQRIDEAEQEDRKDINKLQQIVKQEEKHDWTKWLSIALTGATLIGIGWKAGSYLWECCGTKLFRRRAATAVEDVSAETASAGAAATDSSVESLDARPVEHGSKAGSPIPAIQINSETDYEQSVRNIEDMFHR